MGRIKLAFSDTKELHDLIHALHRSTGVSIAIITDRGRTLVSSGWCDICQPFQAMHKHNKALCQKTRAGIKHALGPDGDTALTHCHLGLIEAAAPITALDKQGYLFIGQFLDTQPRPKLLKQLQSKAAPLGFTREDYPANLKKVPVISEADARQLLRSLADVIRHAIMLDGIAHYRALENSGASETGQGRPMPLANVPVASRKEVEEALRLSEEKYRAIFENAMEGIFQTTLEGRYLNVNPAFARMFGYASAREMMDTITDIGRQLYVDPQDRIRIVHMLKKWGHVDGYESEVYRNDKSRFWVSINVHTIRDPSGNILYFEGTYTDITERKRSESALRESEARFRSLIQNSSDMIVIVDKHGRITYETPSVQRILGYTPGYIIGSAPLDFIHPDDTPNTSSDLEEVFLNLHDGVPTEFRFKRGNGTWVHLEAIGNNLLDYPGINGVVITARDISERKQAEADLTKAWSRYKDLVETTNEFFWEVDPQWRFTYTSPKCVDFLGIEAPELLLKPTLDFMSRGEIKRVWNKVRTQLEQGQDVNNFEHTVIRKDGHRIIMESSIVPVVNEGGETIGYRGVSRDITERKRLEDELTKVQKLDSIGTLAGGIAHDYNNLLTAILGYIGLCKSNLQPTDPLHVLIEKAEKASLSARDLTKQLITFSRGGLPLRKVMDIRDLITQTVKFSLSGSKLKPQYTLASDLSPVYIDEDQIRQVIQNLVINAREAMQDNGDLAIEAANTMLGPNNTYSLPPGDYILVSISDSGKGIPDELLPRVFDPYFSTKELGSQKGMGLGLSICYSIVKKHGGGIHLASKMGSGTTASAFLPVAKG